MVIKNNVLHYYIDLLRIRDSDQRSLEKSKSCIKALHNVIATMRAARHDRICEEDFSRLDWGNIPINNIWFSINGEFPCSFDSCIIKEQNFISGHSSGIIDVLFIKKCTEIITAGEDGLIIRWDIYSGQELMRYDGHNFEVTGIVVYNNDSILISSSVDKTCIWRDIDSGKIIHKIVFDEAINSIDISINGENVLIATCHNIYIINLKTLQITYKYLSQDLISSVQFFGDYVSMICNKEVIIWEYLKNIEKRLKFHQKMVTSYCANIENNLVVTCSLDGYVVIWNLVDGSNKALHIKEKEICNIAISFDGEYCALGLNNGQIFIWNIADDTLKMLESPLYGYRISNLVFSNDNRYLLSSSIDNQNSAILWDMQKKQRLHILNAHTLNITKCRFDNNNQLCVTCSSDQSAIIWDLLSGNLVSELKGHIENVEVVRFSDDGCLLTTASGNNTGIIWNTATGKIRCKLRHSLPIFDITYSNDNSEVLTGSQDHTAILWNSANGKEIRRFIGHNSTVSSVKISPDSKTCLTGSFDKTAILWDKETGRIIKRLEGQNSFIRNVYYSPYNNICITTSLDGLAIIYNSITGELLHKLNEHGTQITNLSFSTDGQKCVTSDCAGTVICWNLYSGSYYFKKQLHSKGGICIAISPDSKFLITGGYDKKVVLCECITGKIIEENEEHQCAIDNVFWTNNSTYVSVSKDMMEVKFLNSTASFYNHFPKRFLDSHHIRRRYISKGNLELDIYESAKIEDFTSYWQVFNQSPQKLLLIDRKERKLKDILYHIPDLYIKNCSFQNIQCSDLIKKIIEQNC